MMRCNGNLPFSLDVSDRPNIVLGGEHKLVVEHPLRFVVKAGGRVQLHDLVVFRRQVVARPLKVGNLQVNNIGSAKVFPTAADKMHKSNFN